MALVTVAITGHVLAPDGSAPTSGRLVVKLSQAGSALDGTEFVRVATEVTEDLGTGGAVSFALAPNDTITPSGTYYLATFVAQLASGRRVQWSEKWQLTSSDLTLDIGAVPRIDAIPGLNIAPFYISGDATAMQAKATGAASFRTIADHLATITPPVNTDPMPITKADGSTEIGSISSSDTFAGYAGTALTGAPRVRLGTKTPMGVTPGGDADDSAVLILRELTGDSLFSHAVRDESTFNTTTTGAYASFDSIPQMSGSTHYNHLHAFQARPQYLAAGTIDAITDFVADLLADSGTVSVRHGLKVNDATGSGTVTSQYGIWVSPLTKGGSNWGIYVASNNSYLGGNLQIAGTFTGATTGSFSGQVDAVALNSTGAAAAYSAGGGAILAGGAGGSVATLLAYSNAGGTEKKIRINPAGVGFVGVGIADPGYMFHVGGSGGFNGNLTLAGTLTGVTSITATGEAKVTGFNATGTPAAYSSNGGIGVWGFEGNAYAVVRAYSNAGGTEKILALNDGGTGGVCIGTTGSGNKITKSLRTTTNLDSLGSIAAGTTVQKTVTLTGAVTTAEVAIGGPSSLEAGLILFAFVSAADTITLRISNVSAGAITPANSQSVGIRVFNP